MGKYDFTGWLKVALAAQVLPVLLLTPMMLLVAFLPEDVGGLLIGGGIGLSVIVVSVILILVSAWVIGKWLKGFLPQTDISRIFFTLFLSGVINILIASSFQVLVYAITLAAVFTLITTFVVWIIFRIFGWKVPRW